VGGYKTSEYFNGVIDEVRISDTIRYFGNFSPAHQAFTSDAHAIALYHFDEGAGTTAYDASGNANHLTLVNSPAWVTSDAPLPIQLAGFTANSVAITVNLEWQTISETNSLGFYVERSASKTGPFTAVSSLIVGAGTSLELHTYSYADNNVGSGTYYYRLHEVDKNGTGSYSSVLTVIVGKNATGVREEEGLPTVFKLMQNYPNPFNPATEIRFWIKDANVTTLKVYNSIGQEIATLVNGMMQPGRYVATWNAGAMPSGVYLYRLESGKNVSVERMLMIK